MEIIFLKLIATLLMLFTVFLILSDIYTSKLLSTITLIIGIIMLMLMCAFLPVAIIAMWMIK